jgi:protein SCO1/2
MKTTRRAMLWTSGLAAGAVAAAVPRTLSASEPALYPPATSAADRVRQLLPNPQLTTHENKRVRFYDDLVRGRTVLINLMYTNCTKSCPATAANLRKVQKYLRESIGDRVLMLSLSVDPARDAPQALADYAEMIGAAPGWLFATGRKSDIDAIRKALGMFDRDNETDGTSHLNLVTIGNEPMGQWCAIPALSTPEDIARTVQRVMRTA